MESEIKKIKRRKSALPLLILLSAAFVLSVAVWWKYAPRFFVFNEAAYGEHWAHTG